MSSLKGSRLRTSSSSRLPRGGGASLLLSRCPQPEGPGRVGMGRGDLERPLATDGQGAPAGPEGAEPSPHGAPRSSSIPPSPSLTSGPPSPARSPRERLAATVGERGRVKSPPRRQLLRPSVGEAGEPLPSPLLPHPGPGAVIHLLVVTGRRGDRSCRPRDAPGPNRTACIAPAPRLEEPSRWSLPERREGRCRGRGG